VLIFGSNMEEAMTQSVGYRFFEEVSPECNGVELGLSPAMINFGNPRQASTPTWREDDDDRAWLHPIHEIDDILVGHTDASGRDGLADIFWLVGAVDTGTGCPLPS
jgi:hypothetical protein